jgi:hypothetical protein
MKIKYYLTENSFKSTPKDKGYVAKIEKPGVLYQEDLIRAMMSKSTVFSQHDIRGVLDLMNETVQEKVFCGYSVHTDLFRTGVSIRGGFAHLDDKFDGERHRVCVNMKASLPFQRRVAKRALVRKVNEQYVIPKITAVEKLGKSRDRAGYAPGDLIEVRGYSLKREDGQSPVYLLSVGQEKTWEKEKISLEVYRVYDRSLLCQIPPSLEPGSYRILVDSSIDRSKEMAEFYKPLEITAPADNSHAE